MKRAFTFTLLMNFSISDKVETPIILLLYYNNITGKDRIVNDYTTYNLYELAFDQSKSFVDNIFSGYDPTILNDTLISKQAEFSALSSLQTIHIKTSFYGKRVLDSSASSSPPQARRRRRQASPGFMQDAPSSAPASDNDTLYSAFTEGVQAIHNTLPLSQMLSMYNTTSLEVGGSSLVKLCADLQGLSQEQFTALYNLTAEQLKFIQNTTVQEIEEAGHNLSVLTVAGATQNLLQSLGEYLSILFCLLACQYLERVLTLFCLEGDQN